MNPRYIKLYIDLADRISEMSYATRAKVGAVIVKDNTILSYGWNGMPTGWENTCEEITWDTGAGGWLDPIEFIEQYPYEKWNEDVGRVVACNLKTKPEVLHAEENAICKVAQSTESSRGAILFCTLAPCLGCAKLIRQSGIETVYYKDAYRSDDGIRFLQTSGINVHKYSDTA